MFTASRDVLSFQDIIHIIHQQISKAKLGFTPEFTIFCEV